MKAFVKSSWARPRVVTVMMAANVVAAMVAETVAATVAARRRKRHM